MTSAIQQSLNFAPVGEHGGDFWSRTSPLDNICIYFCSISAGFFARLQRRGKAIDCMGDDYLVDDRNLPLTLPLFKDLEGDKYGVE